MGKPHRIEDLEILRVDALTRAMDGWNRASQREGQIRDEEYRMYQLRMFSQLPWFKRLWRSASDMPVPNWRLQILVNTRLEVDPTYKNAFGTYKTFLQQAEAYLNQARDLREKN